MRRPLAVIGAIVAALALGLALRAWMLSEVEVADGARAEASRPSTGLLPSPDWLTNATPASPPAASSAPSSVTAAVVAVSLTVTSPRKLLVGEIGELMIGVAANADVGEIGFAVQFDGNVLQVRGGTQGDWAVSPGVNPRFAAEVSTAEDRVQVRSAKPSPLAGVAGGSVALVQFQGLVPGTTTVLITDVTVKDSAGRSLAATVSASNFQVTVDSLPLPPTPALSR